MMNILLKIAVIILTLSTCYGCNERLSYSYLLEHPSVLKDEFDRCQNQDVSVASQKAHCDVVMKAADKFSASMDDMQADPEKYGQKLMDSETALVQLQTNLLAAQQSLQALKDKNAAGSAIATAQKKVDALQQDYAARHQDIKMMLAVIGLRSPE